MTQEEEIRALLEAIAEAREAASKAYEFSGGNAYAHAVALANIKVAKLALAALGTKEDWQ